MRELAPGVGKTALLNVLAGSASASGTMVVRVAGAEFEGEISFTVLNQALLPVLGHLDELDSSHRDALRVALGLGAGPAPDRLLVSNAALALVRHAAARVPVLLILDDLPWIDRASAGVLSFVARRLVGSPGAAGRGRRLAQAAYIGAETIGEMKDTQQLLEAMRQAGPQASDPLYYLPAATFVMLNGDGHIDTIHRLLVGAIEGGHHGYDASDATLVNAMWSLGLVSWSGGRAELWEPFLALMNRLSPQPPALLALNIDMWADPARTGMAALPRLDAALRAVQREVDPHVIENLTASAMYADRLADFREPLWRIAGDRAHPDAIARSGCRCLDSPGTPDRTSRGIGHDQ